MSKDEIGGRKSDFIIERLKALGKIFSVNQASGRVDYITQTYTGESKGKKTFAAIVDKSSATPQVDLDKINAVILESSRIGADGNISFASPEILFTLYKSDAELNAFDETDRGEMGDPNKLVPFEVIFKLDLFKILQKENTQPEEKITNTGGGVIRVETEERTRGKPGLKVVYENSAEKTLKDATLYDYIRAYHYYKSVDEGGVRREQPLEQSRLATTPELCKLMKDIIHNYIPVVKKPTVANPDQTAKVPVGSFFDAKKDVGMLSLDLNNPAVASIVDVVGYSKSLFREFHDSTKMPTATDYANILKSPAGIKRIREWEGGDPDTDYVFTNANKGYKQLDEDITDEEFAEWEKQKMSIVNPPPPVDIDDKSAIPAPVGIRKKHGKAAAVAAVSTQAESKESTDEFGLPKLQTISAEDRGFDDVSSDKPNTLSSKQIGSMVTAESEKPKEERKLTYHEKLYNFIKEHKDTLIGVIGDNDPLLDPYNEKDNDQYDRLKEIYDTATGADFIQPMTETGHGKPKIKGHGKPKFKAYKKKVIKYY